MQEMGLNGGDRIGAGLRRLLIFTPHRNRPVAIQLKQHITTGWIMTTPAWFVKA